ncbi:MAG: aminoacyl-tRNA hydrolase, partial [Parcubacteria group bacterium]|nr:aminoacyl-tRNA hydrolase [Parcubacteria group bacterium]
MEFNPKEIKLIIGLGNPETKYENTYHNVGLQFIKYLKNTLYPIP